MKTKTSDIFPTIILQHESINIFGLFSIRMLEQAHAFYPNTQEAKTEFIAAWSAEWGDQPALHSETLSLHKQTNAQIAFEGQ